MTRTAAILMIAGLAVTQAWAQYADWQAHSPMNVTSLAADDSTVWVGTTGGLVRVHVATRAMDHYHCGNAPFTHNPVAKVLVDYRGGVWSALDDGTVLFFDGASWQVHKPGSGTLPDERPQALLQDTLGRIWLGDIRHLLRYDGNAWTEQTVPWYSGQGGVANGLRKADGSLVLCVGWFLVGVGTFGQDLYVYDYNGWDPLFAVQPAFSQITHLAEDAASNVWFMGAIAPSGTQAVMRCGDTCVESAYPGVHPEFMGNAGRDEIWFGDENGALFRYRDRAWAAWPGMDVSVTATCRDSSGNVWIGGTAGGGSALLQFDGHDVFISHSAPIGGLGLPWSAQRVLFETQDNAVWIQTQNGGLARYTGETWQQLRLSDGRTDFGATKAFIDRDGAVWAEPAPHLMMSYNRLEVHTWSSGAWSRVEPIYSLGLYADAREFVQDTGGVVWVGLATDGVVAFDGSQAVHHTSQSTGMPLDTVVSMLADSRGAVWFGTRSRGLVRYDRGVWEHVDTSHSEVCFLFEDSEGNVWAEAGRTYWPGYGWADWLTRYDGVSAQRYDVQDIFGPSAAGANCRYFVNDMVTDPRGQLWLAGRLGISVFDDSAWTRYQTEVWGLIPGAGAEGFRLLADRQGTLWLAGERGLAGLVGGDVMKWFDEHNSPLTLGDLGAGSAVTSLLEDGTGRLWMTTDGGQVAVYNNGVLAVHHPRVPVTHARQGLSLRATPLAGSFVLEYALPTAGHVRVTVWNAQGRRLAVAVDEHQRAGTHRAIWSADQMTPATGAYIVRVECGGLSQAVLLPATRRAQGR